MKCPSCGAEIAENVVICHSCGTRLDDEPDAGRAPAEAAQTPPTEPGEAAESAEPVQAGEKKAATRSAGAPAAQPADKGEYAPPWKYSLKDMRIIWLNMSLLTAAFVVVGIWLMMIQDKWRPQWLSVPLFWGLLLLVPLVLWLHQLGKLVYRSTITYDLDETRLIHKEGIFVSKTNVIELIRIDDMSATQTLVERFLCGGIGQVHVHSDDPGTPKLVLRGLEHHESVFRQIDQKRAEVRKKKAFVGA